MSALPAAITAEPQPQAPGLLSEDLLRRFDTPGPRYTSYPTADRFTEDFGADAALRTLASSPVAPVSLYVHIPFCESVCYYCACNKVITRHHERAAEYLDALDAEIGLVQAALGARRAATQLHLGGGSPTFLSDAELARVVASLRGAFDLDAQAELSIEVDPRTVTAERLAYLRTLGFSRISFGVQDFDPQVQQAVHRVQPHAAVRDLMHSARELGFESINADLIYGLPKQTPQSFARTIAQIRDLRPDRIALYAYAHLPQRFKPQRRILSDDLPSAAQRVAMLGEAIASLHAGGYGYIGMDHFALPGDALAEAREQGRLHRNFQGYTTQPDGDLIGLGVSAISSVAATYHQNVRTLPEYYAALKQGQLPVQRGVALDRDDLARRAIIMALMCQGRVEFSSIEQAHGVRMSEDFAPELAHLAPLAAAGLVEIEPGAVQVTPTGWYVVRAVAMAFDRHLRREPARERFSRIV
ncbi:MAG TPA: oxygen-independent coproporphyrinogen III oxidase [Burkholderiaceae bacterium]|nr:oxygen-independent coproporphyrinogen III oxidase [Burkholderiaceae bacterium]